MNIQNRNKLLILVTILFSFSGCVKDNISNNFDYKVLKRADLNNLLMFAYGPNILGFDTSDFTIKAQIRIDDMSFGGVTKLPNGGVAFTHNSRKSNGDQGNMLYVTDRNCNFLNKYKICNSPMSPKVFDNLLIISNYNKFQIYSADNFKMLKEFQFQNVMDVNSISEWQNKVYFGANSYPVANGYVVQLDLNTFDTTNIKNNSDFFHDTYLNVTRQDTVLYIVDRINNKICIYNFQTKTIQLTAAISTYPEVNTTIYTALNLPYYKNGYLYCFFEAGDGYGPITYWAKFNASTLALIQHKQLISQIGMFPTSFYAGRFFVIQFDNGVVSFIDVESGEIVKSIFLNVKYY